MRLLAQDVNRNRQTKMNKTIDLLDWLKCTFPFAQITWPMSYYTSLTGGTPISLTFRNKHTAAAEIASIKYFRSKLAALGAWDCCKSPNR